MGVSDGQLANENIFNGAFMARNADTDTVGKIDLKNVSSTQIIDVQKVINDLLLGRSSYSTNSQTGEDVAMPAPTTAVVIFIAAILSIRTIAPPSDTTKVTSVVGINRSGGQLKLIAADADTDDIAIPTGDASIPDGGAFILIYDPQTSGRWRLISGGGGGGALAAGEETIGNGDIEVAVVFADELATDEYVISASFKNIVDGDGDQQFIFYKIKAQSTTGFTLLLNQEILGANNTCVWSVVKKT